MLPFAGAALNGLLTGRIPARASTPSRWERPGARCCWPLAAIWTVRPPLSPRAFEQSLYTWAASDVQLDVGFQLDRCRAVMLFVVTFVGFLIHVYSVGYMAHEEGYQRYFAYLNLFMGAMLLLVLGNNFLVLFVGWEGVGLCSYLLIGFYFDQEFPPYAGARRSSSTGSATSPFWWVCSLWSSASARWTSARSSGDRARSRRW